jgi:hypothetical protein
MDQIKKYRRFIDEVERDYRVFQLHQKMYPVSCKLTDEQYFQNRLLKLNDNIKKFQQQHLDLECLCGKSLPETLNLTDLKDQRRRLEFLLTL